MASGASSPPREKLSFTEKWKARIQKDPAVYVFLGLTVVALTRGLGAMMSNDRKTSQRMMRFRVFFQLATVSALVGGIYYRAYKYADDDPNGMFGKKAPRSDSRVFLNDPRIIDTVEEAAAAARVTGAAGVLTPVLDSDVDAGAVKPQALQ